MGFVRNLTGATGAARAAESGARIQQEGGQLAIAEQRRALERSLAVQAPFRQAGERALGSLFGEIGRDVDSSQVTENPFFQAMAQEQEQRLLQSQAARGKVGSGETGDTLTRNLLLLGNQFQQQLQGQQQQRVSNLFNVADLGARASGASAGAIQGTGQGIGGLLTQVANAQSAGQVQAANIRGQAKGQLFGAALGAGLGAATGGLGLLGGGVGAGGGALLGGLSGFR